YSSAVGASPSSSRRTTSWYTMSRAADGSSAYRGQAARYSSARTRSPRGQRRNWSARTKSTHSAQVEASTGSTADLGIADLVEAEFLGRAVDGPAQPLAERFGTVAHLGGQLGPAVAFRPPPGAP